MKDDVQAKQQSIQALAKLRGLAESNGVSMTAIAEHLGIRPATVGQMLNARFQPGLHLVFRALAAINFLSGKQYGLADLDE